MARLAVPLIERNLVNRVLFNTRRPSPAARRGRAHREGFDRVKQRTSVAQITMPRSIDGVRISFLRIGIAGKKVAHFIGNQYSHKKR